MIFWYRYKTVSGIKFHLLSEKNKETQEFSIDLLDFHKYLNRDSRI